MPLPLPHEVTDPATMSNLREIQGYLSGTEQSIAEAKLAAATALKAADTQPAAQVSNSTNQAIATGTPTILAFDSEFIDTDNLHDNVTNNSRLTIQTAGLYLVFANVHWSGAAVNDVSIFLNGVQVAQNPGVTRAQATFLGTLVPTDYVQAQVNQTSGGPLNALASGTTFTAARLSAG